jgi:mono/diheme cytochrome c family protein
MQETIVNQRIGIKAVGALVLGGLCTVISAGSISSLAYGQQVGGALTPAEEAEETFQARCSTCHAKHGEGSEVGASLNVPDLRSAYVQKNSDAKLRQIIKNGKGNMPAFGRDFSEQQIDRIIQLVRGFGAESNRQAQAQPSSTR